MSKKEFIAGLREALMLKMDQAKIQEQVDFYSHYIEEEVRKGRRESDVISEMGEPWVIAKTILATEGVESEYTEYSETTTERTVSSGHKAAKGEKGPYVWSTNSSKGCWMALIAVVLVIIVAMTLFVSVIRLFAPILYPLILAILVIRLFRSRK